MLSRPRIAAFCSFILLLCTPVLFAETIRFDPPNAIANRSVDATVAGIWPDGCVPSIKSVTIANATITLHLNADLAPDAGCFESLTQYSRTFHLGVLPAGGYTVIAAADQGSTSTVLAQTPLNIRDAETLRITPYAMPVSGGTIAIENPFYPAAVTITIAGVPSPAGSGVDLFVNAPPHVPGAVDVAVSSIAGATESKAALIYYDPAVADPAVFEPILFPLSFQGPGAFGSQWTTESFILPGSSTAYFRDALPCDSCSTAISTSTKQLTNDGNPWGHVLYAIRDTAGSRDFASRIRDTSRQSQTAGTEIPVVRERDFRGLLQFQNVPTDSRYRAMLRVWSLGDYPQFLVNVESVPSLPLSVTRIPGTAMWFGSLDVTPLLSKTGTTPASVTVYPSGYPSILSPVLFPPIWGMLSITNNDTQQVTIISPQ